MAQRIDFDHRVTHPAKRRESVAAGGGKTSSTGQKSTQVQHGSFPSPIQRERRAPHRVCGISADLEDSDQRLQAELASESRRRHWARIPLRKGFRKCGRQWTGEGCAWVERRFRRMAPSPFNKMVGAQAQPPPPQQSDRSKPVRAHRAQREAQWVGKSASKGPKQATPHRQGRRPAQSDPSALRDRGR